MAMITLNEEWQTLMETYASDHQNPANQKCHLVGIPMIAASLPVGATVVGLPLAAGMVTVGWAFQFLGHKLEGKPPSFVNDRRNFIVGLIWWTRKVGLPVA